MLSTTHLAKTWTDDVPRALSPAMGLVPSTFARRWTSCTAAVGGVAQWSWKARVALAVAASVLPALAIAALVHAHLLFLFSRTEWAGIVGGTIGYFAASWFGLAVAMLAALSRAASTRVRLLLTVVATTWLLLVAETLRGITYGTMTWSASVSCPPATVEYFFMTIDRNADRREALISEMSRSGIHVEPITGIDAAKYASTEELLKKNGVDVREPPPPPNERSYVGVTLAHQRAVEKMAQTSKADWVVLFEDDARVLPWFHDYVARATCEYAELDMVWLDTRNAPNWYFLKRLDGGCNGVMYRRSSLSKVASLLDYNNPLMLQARKQFKGFFATGIDVSLARFCNAGKLSCASLPLVVESGAAKTTIMPPAPGDGAGVAVALTRAQSPSNNPRPTRVGGRGEGGDGDDDDDDDDDGDD